MLLFSLNSFVKGHLIKVGNLTIVNTIYFIEELFRLLSVVILKYEFLELHILSTHKLFFKAQTLEDQRTFVGQCSKRKQCLVVN